MKQCMQQQQQKQRNMQKTYPHEMSILEEQKTEMDVVACPARYEEFCEVLDLQT